MTNTTAHTHYLGGTATNPLCNMTMKLADAMGHRVSIFSADVNCRACLTEIDRMASIGFIPRR